MTALTSIDAVRRKILSLQQAADDAEDRAELLQMEADMERQGRKGVKHQPSAARKRRRRPEVKRNQLIRSTSALECGI